MKPDFLLRKIYAGGCVFRIRPACQIFYNVIVVKTFTALNIGREIVVVRFCRQALRQRCRAVKSYIPESLKRVRLEKENGLPLMKELTVTDSSFKKKRTEFRIVPNVGFGFVIRRIIDFAAIFSGVP